MNDPTADLALAYRLLCAANLAYGVTRDAEATSTLEILPPILPDVATLDVLRDRVGFLPGSIHLHQAMARDGIDAYLYGEIKDAAILAFRGTLPMRLTGRLPQILGDWFNNTRALLVDGQRLGLPGCVHQGYAESLDLLWQAPDGITGILGRIADATAAGRRLLLTGHSKGGALAMLAALRLAATGLPGVKPAEVVTFGAPQTGDGTFATAFDQVFAGRAWRFEYQDDIVPHLPPSTSFWLAMKEVLSRRLEQPDEWSWSLLAADTLAWVQMRGYEPVGQLQFIDWNGRLRTDDTEQLRAERWQRLGLALTSALPEINRDHLPMRGYGYMDFLEAHVR